MGAKISKFLRGRIEALVADPSPITEATFSVLVRTEDFYTEITQTLKKDVIEFIDLSARMWLNSVLRGAMPLQEDMDLLGAFGRRRFHQGVPLASVVHAFRLGCRETWRILLALDEDNAALHEELLYVISPYLLDHFDAMAHAVQKAYLDEEHKQSRWHDALCHELCNIIFSFPDDTPGFWRCAEALGLDATVPRIALAVETHLKQSEPARREEELDRLMLSFSRQMKFQLKDLVRTIQRGRLVVWIPGAHGESLIVSERRMADLCSAMVKRLPEIHKLGIGLMHEGARGWATSVEEAFKALESGRRRSGGRVVHAYSEIILNECVRGSKDVVHYLGSLIERLNYEPELLATLDAFFLNKQQRKTTSKKLGIHPNTLNNRIERIESLLGAKLDDVDWLAKLGLALELRRSSQGTG